MNITYKEWLYKKIGEEIAKGGKVDEFITGAPLVHTGGVGLVGEQLALLEKTKEPIKKAIASNNLRKEKIRQIESLSRRTLHFIFNPVSKPNGALI